MRRLLTRKELCELLGISYSTLNRLMNAGEIIPIFGRGRKLLFCPDAVDALIRSRQALPIPSPTVPRSKERRQQDVDRQRRIELARQALERHAAGRKK